MLTIEIPGQEMFNEETSEFQTTKSIWLQLEHSLVSISKWESKWKKPFLSSEKSQEEVFDYIKCMTINANVQNEIYNLIPTEKFQEIMDYISDSMTATTFSKEQSKGSREIITAEIIYYWMIAQNIPFECRKWHLNKLLTLIKVCAVKNAPPKKMGKRTTMQQNTALNAQRKAALNTKG